MNRLTLLLGSLCCYKKKLQYHWESTKMEDDLNMGVSQSCLNLHNPPSNSLFIFSIERIGDFFRTVHNWHPKFWSPTFLSTVGALKSVGISISVPKKGGHFWTLSKDPWMPRETLAPEAKSNSTPNSWWNLLINVFIPKWEIFFTNLPLTFKKKVCIFGGIHF